MAWTLFPWARRLVHRPFARPPIRPAIEELEPRRMLSADVLTYHNDNARAGADLSETILTPGNVNSTTFGKLFVDGVDGKVDAQPLYMANVAIAGKGTHNVLFVATEHDSVYAFDADSNTGANALPLWQVSFLSGAGVSTVPSTDVNCNQVTPEIGITATPVIDPTSGTIYVVAMTKEVSGSTTNYVQRLHALDITSGAEKFGGPKVIQASVPGTGEGGSTVVFNPFSYKERPGLLLLNGVVYTFWSSHCDIATYHGWVIGYNASNLSQVSVFNVTPDANAASIWTSGAAPAADGNGNIYFLTGNGTFDANTGGRDYGDTFLKLTTSGGTTVADFFTPHNQQALANGDVDLGSGGVLVLPDSLGSAAHPHLAIGAGKEGTLYLVDRDNMGHFSLTGDNIVEELPGAIGAQFGMPAYFNNKIYFGGVGDVLKAFQILNGGVQVTPVSQSANAFGYPGTTPSISANGTTNGIVWAAENGATAVLHAYDANDLSNELYNSNQAGARDHFGTGNKFITPTIANGKVYVGTTNGVGVFGLVSNAPGAPANLTPSATNTQVTLNWTASGGATSYKIYRGTSSGGEGSTPLQGGATGTTFTDMSVTHGTTYFYQVSAVNGSGEGGKSREVQAYVLTPQERLVRALYLDFLGRPGSVTELDGWVSQLPGAGQAGITTAILYSGEAMKRMVDSFYIHFLGRSPSNNEDMGWVHALVARQVNAEQVIAGFLQSGEFAARANALIVRSDPNNDSVRALFSLVLDRAGGAVTDGEVNGWIAGVAAQGKGRMTLDFVTSPEFRAGMIRTFYGDNSLVLFPYQMFAPNLLHRSMPPGSSEVNSWVNSGFDLLTIEQYFASGPEFFMQS